MPKLPQNEEEKDKIIKANFSALLYLLTEQQALIGRLLSTLLECGIVSVPGLKKITDITEGSGGLTPTYNQIYNRFAKYYINSKGILDRMEKEENAKDLEQDHEPVKEDFFSFEQVIEDIEKDNLILEQLRRLRDGSPDKDGKDD